MHATRAPSATSPHTSPARTAVSPPPPWSPSAPACAVAATPRAHRRRLRRALSQLPEPAGSHHGPEARAPPTSIAPASGAASAGAAVLAYSASATQHPHAMPATCPPGAATWAPRAPLASAKQLQTSGPERAPVVQWAVRWAAAAQQVGKSEKRSLGGRGRRGGGSVSASEHRLQRFHLTHKRHRPELIARRAQCDGLALQRGDAGLDHLGWRRPRWRWRRAT